MEKVYQEIRTIGEKYSADKIVLFGSRARGDHREKSDIDIAVYGVSGEKHFAFSNDIGNIPTLLQFDIVFITADTPVALINNINKDGVTLMNKLDEKLQKFIEATNRLEEALKEYEQYAILSSRDGVIQRFEFCTELAWKSTREYLLSEGYVDINSPKTVMKQAYADNLIEDEQAWLKLLYSRNLTSHIYDDNTATEIFHSIKDEYLSLFRKLIEKLKA